MLRDSLIAAIRTGVAALVGIFVAWLVSRGFELDAAFEANLVTTLSVLFIAGYNYLVNVLERKVNPMFGILLGIPKAPAYGAVGTRTVTTRSETGAVDSTVIAGVIVLVIGLLIWLGSTANLIGIVITIVGVIIAALGAARGSARI